MPLNGSTVNNERKDFMANLKRNLAKELAAMSKMTAKQLRERYAELHGEASRSGNKQWLLRRCAWRLQSLEEGGLSERAQQRARQLARDQDIRVIPPSGMKMDPLNHEPEVVASSRNYIQPQRDDRLPMPGTRLTRVYKGYQYQVEVLVNGFAYEGQRYQSLSAVAYAITGSHWNGYLFFNLKTPKESA